MLFFSLNSGLLRMFKGFLLADYQLYIIFSFFLSHIIFFSQELILLLHRKGHAYDVKKKKPNCTSPSVFKTSSKIFCLNMVSASLLPTYKVLWSQHLEPFSAWQKMEYFKLKQVSKEPMALWTVTNTSLSFRNIGESSAFRLRVRTTTNRRKG